MLGVFLAVTLAFSSIQTKDVKCEEIKVFFDGSQVICLGKSEIISLVKKADRKLLGENLSRVNAELIEQAVEKHSTIENAEVYKTVAKNGNSYKGILAVRIKYRTPVLRIISGNKSYFLDKDGKQIPISTNYSANVLAVTGKIKERFARDKILPFVLYIVEDEFWNAQIEQIHVNAEDDIILTPLVGGHLIEFGSVDNYQEKFRNLRAFYEKVLVNNNWNKYNRINLAYKNQVIGIKR
ncbi:hypothetical protein MNBD_BACTEROID01-483 [hydrothermal vent metagenome]|uniref:Cell division protein FtsQ n=1 Tax=hydrothermal vent metagenome TaxID=652676 RepID=A0A3B0TPG4_9ZZZZ